ncbi:hypothetical protein M427DRAFT_57540 [Gonapodya prolifera JEL478]|uniref:Eukaryotic translation initiation factor 5B n=1 Tax=Gonapodya prolifera (strain JEL478) TaxID=1344416 RepID=A0A139AD09_GONPJ|nr:hypothetical protein M427DRAFT_57540 [Gonapodya prolifera JEL478]|eukprot:KXS14638.1 hypothetical protein M427DRAFT_57540 [Gonapodya prolifera JEL478]
MVKKKPAQKVAAAKGKAAEVEIEFDDVPAPPEAPASQNSFNVDEEGNDLGGLMALVSKAARKDGGGGGGKKGKKNRRGDDDEEDAAAILARLDEQESEAAAIRASSAAGAKSTADEPSAISGKKNGPGSVVSEGSSKAKGDAKSTKQGATPVNGASRPSSSVPAKPEKAAVDNDSDEAEEGGGTEIRIKSKKEKERERKERQKQAKKGQQGQGGASAPQESASASAQPSSVPKETATTAPAPAPQPEEDEAGEPEDGGANATGGSKDKKKKKKKPAAAEPPVPAPAPKRKGPNVAALKELLELQRKAEEEARRKQEEEERRIREEEERIAEEERKKEEAKQRKKEKEKAKKEQLKREGQYMTAKQKEQLELARLRTQQLLKAQGVTIAALVDKDAESEPAADEAPKKRGVASLYGKKKKGGASASNAAPSQSRPESRASSAAPEHVVETATAKKEVIDVPKDDENVKDSWDAESDDDKVKDSWDAESDEEKPKKEAPQKVSADDKAKTPVVASAPAQNGSKSQDAEVDEGDESEEESDGEEAAAKEEEKPKELRSPICVVLGHVDAGKTKLLDKIRQTNVQEGEAGGITQQIGATYFPIDAIQQKAEKLALDSGFEFKVPGLLIIDTPGHESFSNLRSRGSSLCNIAILVVDILSGLEAQTRESIGLLRQRKTPFVVALNKVDRLYGWKSTPGGAIRDSFAIQPKSTMQEFDDRLRRVMGQLAEEGLNSKMYYENESFARNVSIVPTSAMTGEGIPDLLYLVLKLTQERMTKNLMYLSEIEATVLEVKVVEGLGTTVDVILSNGILKEGDRIVLCGMSGPIVTSIRALLTPQPMREIRVKSPYVHHKQVKAAMGVKISANNLDGAIAGSRLLVVGPDDDEDELREEVMEDLAQLMASIDRSGVGVCVQASTLGSLEALMTYLKQMKIPVSGFNLGTVHKKDVTRASVMLERSREYAQILAFDVKVDREAELEADSLGVRIFKADVIYHLFDAFKQYMDGILEQKRKDQAPQAIFPCVLRIVPGAVFNKRNPIVVGVDVVEGQLRVGTPLAAVTGPTSSIVLIGKVTSIELNHKARDVVKKGEPAVAIKIESASYEAPKLIGRHFLEKDTIISAITRQSIDVLKDSFRNDVSKDEWATIVKLKKLLSIS